MGCTSSAELFEPKAFDNKIIVWFLGGGPGSPKQQVTEFLTQKYKFKYISVLELIHFEENSGSPQTIEIRKAIEDKVEFSSNLLLRILKKVIILYGPRKYLIDNFPRNMADVAQFETLCKKHPEVKFESFLQLDMPESQMKESGMKTLGELKKDSSVEDIEKEVRSIIESYRAKFKLILQHYAGKQQLTRINCASSDVQVTLTQLQSQLALKQIKPVHFVPMFFINGNEEEEINSFGQRLSRLYNFKYWSMKELMDQYRVRPEINGYLTNRKEQDIQGEFLAELISKKLEKYNYKGTYLINGFPRSEDDVAALRVKFREEINILAYAGCLHTPTTQKEKESFEKIFKFFSLEEEMQSILINSSQASFAQISTHLNKIVPKVAKGYSKIVFFPTFESEGIEHLKKLEEWCEVIDFQQLLRNEIKNKKLVSDLLNSSLTLKKAIPSYIAINIFSSRMEAVNSKENPKVLVFKGFPQSIEQLKILLSRNQLIKVFCGMFIESSRIRKNRKDANEADLAVYEKMCKYLTGCSDQVFKINQKTTYQELKGCIDSL